MDYLAQINRAIDYIEEHLEGELVIDQISQEAGISKWHFQRVFKAVLGETVKEYITRRRLSLAAQELIGTNSKILDIAMNFGFESHEVFTRSFKKLFEISPSELRAQKGSFMIPVKPRITRNYIYHLFEGISMEAKIVKIQKSLVRGVSAKISLVNSAEFSTNLDVIPKLWAKLRTQIGVLNYPKMSLIDEEMNYFAGVLLNDEEVFQHLERREIPEGDYAEFLHTGPMSNIIHTMNYIYGSWFPKTGKIRGNGPDLSMHTEKTNPTSSENEIRILIPLR